MVRHPKALAAGIVAAIVVIAVIVIAVTSSGSTILVLTANNGKYKCKCTSNIQGGTSWQGPIKVNASTPIPAGAVCPPPGTPGSPCPR
jgi:hypothetical protein